VDQSGTTSKRPVNTRRDSGRCAATLLGHYLGRNNLERAFGGCDDGGDLSSVVRRIPVRFQLQDVPIPIQKATDLQRPHQAAGIDATVHYGHSP
jgi:hypothetical protein